MSLQREIARKHPFDLPQQEAWLNLQRTASRLAEPFDRLFRAHGLSEASYNVLRILRGVQEEPEAGRHGLPCGEIARRLVSRGPDLTRLVDRLVRDGLVERCPDATDRRLVLVQLTRKGHDQLALLDDPVAGLHRTQLDHLSARQLDQLNELLVLARTTPPGASDDAAND